jgi:hypothetical protein
MSIRRFANTNILSIHVYSHLGYIPMIMWVYTHTLDPPWGYGYRKADPYPYPMVPIPTTHHGYVIPMHLPIPAGFGLCVKDTICYLSVISHMSLSIGNDGPKFPRCLRCLRLNFKQTFQGAAASASL